AERLVAPASANGAPDKRWVSALEGVVDCLRRSDFRSLAASGFFLKMHRGESYYGGPMPPEFTTLAGEIEPHLRKALVAEVAKKLEGALTVLPIASAALARVQREQGVFGFADIGRGVSRAASDKSSPVSNPETLRDAIGADIRDLAIDEAQDTSVEQYKSMRPLLEEVLAGVRDGRFLLVGDPKQSIYGWRGGTPGLIAHIETAHAGQLGQGDSLTKSYRSSPLVMDYVNRVFGDLGTDLLALVDDEHKSELVKVANWVRDRGLPADCTVSAFKRAVAAWPFARHESAKPKLGGRLAAYAYGKTKEDGDQPAREVTACACAAAIAARIHREAPGRSIGILVRSNKEITQTVAELKALGVAASDEGRATLLDSPAVQRVAALLRLIDDPGDRISHFLVSRGAMQAATGLDPIERHGRRSDATRAAEGYAARCRAEIADVGLAEFLRGVYAKLAQQGLSARDAGRLARVIAIAEDFADRPPARLVDFLDAVAADKADSSSSDRIRVMTVHKSKGLEFDEVVAISLDEGMGAADADWGVLATSPIQPPVMVSPLTNAGIREWVPELAVFERDERRRALLDDLSRLYVALTRARQGLHLVMKIPSKSSSGATLPTAAKLIVRALDAASRAGVSDSLVGAEPLGAKLAAALPDAEQPFWTHSFGSMPSANAGAPPHGVAAANAGAPPHGAELEPLPVEIVRHRAARAAAPSMHADDALSPWRFDPFRDDNIALRGVLVHECFREVETARDLATAEQRAALVARAAIRASVEKGEPVPQEVIDGVLTLLERVALGVTGRALRGGGDVRVRTELPFVRETPGGLVHGRIDRLELDVRDGKVVGATIIDFKTGATGASASDLAEIKRGYFEQLDGYAEAVEEMFGVPKSAISRVLLFVDRDERHG
ncbi:MAG: ATP-dependent helicase/nuclease subunit, partial [Planctomycetota bacterium]